MLIQNISSPAIASSFTGNSEAVPVATPSTQTAPVEVPQSAPASQQAAQPTDAQLKSAVDSINQAMKQTNPNVEFSIEKGSNQTVIKVMDSQTGQLITQFPSKAAMAMSQMIAQAKPGALIEQKA